MNKRVLAVIAGLALVTAGECALFLWLNDAAIAERRADALLGRGAHAPAVELYQRILRRQPDRTDLWVSLARALARMGRLDEAGRALQQALARVPGHRGARQLELELAWQRNDRPGVIDAAQAILSGEPDNLAVRRDLARALAAVGRLDEADAEYRHLSASGPLDASALLERAALLQRKGDLAGAIASVRQALASSPDDQRILLLLADLLAADGQFAQAAGSYQQYLRRSPDDWAARLRLAGVLNAVQAFDRAAAEYRAVLERAPDDAETRLKLARSLSWSKRYDESIDEYRRVLGDR